MVDKSSYQKQRKENPYYYYKKNNIDITTIPPETGQIRDIQLAKLALLKELDYVCKQNGLKYWIDFGTLLGAIRHKGFIPWDDDMDFAVPYQQYAELISVLNKELPPNLRCLTYDSSETYKIPWIKVEDVGTKVIDNSSYLEEDKMPGLIIDI